MNPTRRSFLGGLAVASALSGATAAVAAKNQEASSEFLRLQSAFDATNAKLVNVADALPTHREAYNAIAPAGHGLVFEEHTAAWRAMRGEVEPFTDPSSHTYETLKANSGWRLFRVTSYRVEQLMEVAPKREMRRLRKLRDDSMSFDAAIDAALATSGLGPLLQSYWSAEVELRRVVQEVVKYRATSLAEVALKVRATSAYAALGAEERFAASQWLANAVWDDIPELTTA